ncbi:MAG: hypothetical protein AAF334_11490 [Pseudomonadota bacterium]
MAFQLTAHLAGRGVIVDREDYDAIHAVTQISEQDITSEIEHEFWAAYARIVSQLEEGEDPEGIYYTAMFEKPQGKRPSVTTDFHRRSLTFYSRGIAIIALSVLALLVLSLAYGTAVNNILRTLTALEAERFSIQAENYEATRLRGIEPSACEYKQTPGEPSACDSALDSIDGQYRQSAKLLHDFVFLGLIERAADAGTYRIRTIAQQIFIFLSDYIYPLLAGALGACVSLLRMIFANLREKKLHVRMFKSAYLRIAVGTIAGIVIGWVASVETATGISLTPLALAFAAGYAVEVIYNLLDRTVAAFSTPMSNDAKNGSARSNGQGTHHDRI